MSRTLRSELPASANPLRRSLRAAYRADEAPCAEALLRIPDAETAGVGDWENSAAT